MPYFDFSSPAKKVKHINNPKIRNKWTILKSNIKAVVDINEDLDYIAIIDENNQLLIHPDCYKCKNHRDIYSRFLHGKFKQRVIISRLTDYYRENKPYLPFAVGCVIIGDIIFRNDDLISYFKIKKCYIDNNDEMANRITKAFKTIYNDELEQRIINHYYNDD